MKKLLIVLVIFISVSTAFAQTQNNPVEYGKKQTDRYVTNRFGDNWFMSVAAGGQVYMGQWDTEGSFNRRITPALNLSFGKWISPKVGLRFGVDGYELKGFSQSAGGYSTSMVSNGIYKQQWNYFNLHADVLYNFSTVVAGYNPRRVYSCIPYIGIGWAHGFSIPNNAFSFNGGIINRFRINDALSLSLELKGMIVDASFDSEPNSINVEGICAVLVGVTYRFKTRTFERYKEAAPVNVVEYTNEIDRLKDQLSAEQQRSKELSGSLADTKNDKPQIIERVTTEVAPLALFFEIGSARLNRKDILNLGYLAEVIRNTPGKVFEVTGYADQATGSAQRNRELREQRADNVCSELVNRYGIDRKQLRVVPCNDGLLAEDPSLNRAVVIR